MHMHALPGNHGQTVELDLCFQCQGMWFDPQENLKLTPVAVAELFRLLHEQRALHHLPLPGRPWAFQRVFIVHDREGFCPPADPPRD